MEYIFIIFFISIIIYFLQGDTLFSNVNIEHFKKKSSFEKSMSSASKSISKATSSATKSITKAADDTTKFITKAADDTTKFITKAADDIAKPFSPPEAKPATPPPATPIAPPPTSSGRDIVIPAPIAVPIKIINIELPKLSTELLLDNYTKTKPSTEQEARATIGTVRSQVEYSKIYPIGINFDAQFNNYNNLLSNTSISILNEILTNTQYKANEKSSIINFNSEFKPVQNLLVTENDVLDYGNYIVSLMNGVSNTGNSFVFKKVIPITKEQYESQIRLNFQIEVLYKYPKSNKNQVELVPTDFTILLNTVMLFEKSSSNIEHFKKSSFEKSMSSATKSISKGVTSATKSISKGVTSGTKPKSTPKSKPKSTPPPPPSNVKSYLETLSLLGIGNYGFLPGYQK